METLKTPFFSVITVTLNNLGGLRRTHESLAAQSECDCEWIVVDGGSGDGTREFLRIHENWISEPDRGIFDAMNKGIERARGRYILFLNAGDVLAAPDVLKKIKEGIETQKSKPDFVYGDSREGNFYKSARAPHSYGMFTHHQAMIYARDKMGRMRYDLDYAIASDYDFTQRFLQQYKNILYCPFAFCVFESGGISQMQAAKARREEFMIRKKAGIGFVRNSFIYIRQSAAWTLRQYAPHLYWAIKSSGNNRSGF